MLQTEARRTLKDAPLMWRRINSIGIILDCNSTYAANLGYVKSEIIGRSIFAHVPRESWDVMTESLTRWFETGRVKDKRITFLRENGTTFPGLLHATSIYDHTNTLMGSNTVIFDLSAMSDEYVATCSEFIVQANYRLGIIKAKEYDQMDRLSRSEYNGLKEMFEVLVNLDLSKLDSISL